MLGTTLDYSAMRSGGADSEAIKAFTSLNIFEADRLEEGPIAVVRLPYALPLGLHGKFVPRV